MYIHIYCLSRCMAWRCLRALASSGQESFEQQRPPEGSCQPGQHSNPVEEHCPEIVHWWEEASCDEESHGTLGGPFDFHFAGPKRNANMKPWARLPRNAWLSWWRRQGLQFQHCQMSGQIHHKMEAQSRRRMIAQRVQLVWLSTSTLHLELWRMWKKFWLQRASNRACKPHEEMWHAQSAKSPNQTWRSYWTTRRSSWCQPLHSSMGNGNWAAKQARSKRKSHGLQTTQPRPLRCSFKSWRPRLCWLVGIRCK